MPNHFRLQVHGAPIDFYDFINAPDFEGKARGLEPFFNRMPSGHVRSVFPSYLIFVIRAKPRGGSGGGTWLPRQVRRAFEGREAVTGVSDADLQALVLAPGKALIGIPQDRWSRPVRSMKVTVFHEVGHAVDYSLNLSPPGATANDFRGVRPVCGGGNTLKRYVVEAYARLIYAPARICRDVEQGAMAACSRRVSNLLRRSPAFSAVPEAWGSPSFRQSEEPAPASEQVQRAMSQGGIIDPWTGAISSGLVDPWEGDP